MNLIFGGNMPALPSGLSIEVYEHDGTDTPPTLATIVDRAGGVILQPGFVTDVSGRFEFGAEDGLYDIKMGGGGGAPDTSWNGGSALWIRGQEMYVPAIAAAGTYLRRSDDNDKYETKTAAQMADDLMSQRDFRGRNKIINGCFRVNQRAVSGTVVLSAGEYGHDRFKAGASGCTYTFETSGNVTTLTITAGSLQQVIEGENLVSGPHVLSWSGTCQGKIGAGSYGPTGVTSTITGGEATTVEFGTGTLSLPQFEIGSVATPYEHRFGVVELSLCQRFFALVTGTLRWVPPAPSLYFDTHITFPVVMRAAPTVSLENAGVYNNILDVSTPEVTTKGMRLSMQNISASVDTYLLSRTYALDAEL